KDTKVLILTTFNLDEYVIGALRAGASGFLLKDATPQELVRSVRAVAAGDAALAPEITRLVLEMVRVPQQDEVIANRAIEGLSAREMEVLKLLAQGMSNSEVAERLFVSETTVKSHVSHLLAKLGLRDRVQAVVMAYELGIIRPGEK
ncbi:two-component system response regulator, partial [mine drainage metagenome]